MLLYCRQKTLILAGLISILGTNLFAVEVNSIPELTAQKKDSVSFSLQAGHIRSKGALLLAEIFKSEQNRDLIKNHTSEIIQAILVTPVGHKIFETIKKYGLFISKYRLDGLTTKQIADAVAAQVEFHVNASEWVKDRSYLYYESMVITVYSGMSSEVLIRKLAHELYQIADKVNYLETSQNDDELFLAIPITDFKSPTELCLPLLVLTNESVRNTFSSARASYAEELISEKLGLSLMPHLKVQSIERLASLRIYYDGTLSEWWPGLESEHVGKMKLNCQKSTDLSKVNHVLQLGLFDWLKSKATLHGQSLLQYLTKPQLLDHIREYNRNSGPRGSVGAGDP